MDSKGLIEGSIVGFMLGSFDGCAVGSPLGTLLHHVRECVMVYKLHLLLVDHLVQNSSTVGSQVGSYDGCDVGVIDGWTVSNDVGSCVG